MASHTIDEVHQISQRTKHRAGSTPGLTCGCLSRRADGRLRLFVECTRALCHFTDYDDDERICTPGKCKLKF